MYPVKVIILIVSAVIVPGLALAQSSPDDRYRIHLTIGGTRILGSQERAELLLGKSPAEQAAILDSALPTLINGSRAQLSVSVTDPAGATIDYSRSSRLKYEHFGCLTITNAGLMTVRPSGPCDGANRPGLWIAFTDASGRPIAYNEFLFQIP